MTFTGTIRGKEYTITAKPVFNDDDRLLGYSIKTEANLTASEVASLLKGQL